MKRVIIAIPMLIWCYILIGWDFISLDEKEFDNKYNK
jgi:hypothetical protein